MRRTNVFELLRNGQIDELRECLKKSPELIDAFLENGSTLLAEASALGKTELVGFLLEEGAAPSLPTKKIDPLLFPREGLTALDFACQCKRQDIVDILLPLAATEELASALLSAAEGGDISIAKKILARGADINSSEKYGWTPVIAALMSWQSDMMRFLVERGADIHRCYDGRPHPYGHEIEFEKRSLLSLAVEKKLDYVQFLVDKGADLNAADAEGLTPLMLAVRMRDLPVVKLLLSRGANPNSVDKKGRTVLQQLSEPHEGIEALLGKPS